MPALDGTRQFHARVAANVLAIVGRELASGDDLLRAEQRRLRELLDVADDRDETGGTSLLESVRALNARVADRIRNGDADDGPWRSAVLAHLRTTAAERLAIANPKYAAPRDR